MTDPTQKHPHLDQMMGLLNRFAMRVLEAPIEKGAAAFGIARSFTGRRWLLKSVDEGKERELLREISPVLSRQMADAVRENI